MSDNLPVPEPKGTFLFYQTEDGSTKLQVRVEDNTVWLTQAVIAELYQTTKQNVSLHIQNIYEEGELDPSATVKKYLTVQTEGSRQVQRALDYYNLEVILAVGYRVRSARGTQFRQWATAQLRELLVKGFVLDDERLKEGRSLGQDYFDELLERIRDIRAAERRFYQKVTDIYATSIDYDGKAPITQTFYATVQNKLHWAIHQHTAAEIIVKRADAGKPSMGLTTWKNAPKGPVRKSDVAVAKNYLTEEELSALNRIVSMYLDYAELQAQNQRPMHMADWIAKLDAFLEFNERNVLIHAGKVSHDLAVEHAEREFARYDAERRRRADLEASSDFDRAVEDLKKLEEPTAPKADEKKKRRKRKGDN